MIVKITFDGSGGSEIEHCGCDRCGKEFPVEHEVSSAEWQLDHWEGWEGVWPFDEFVQLCWECLAERNYEEVMMK